MQNILLVRTDFFGDCVLSSVFLEMLTRHFNLTVDVLATNYNRGAFEHHPSVRNLYLLDHNPSTKQLANNTNLFRQLTTRYDLTIVLNRDIRNYRYLSAISTKLVFGHRLGRKSFRSNLFCSLAGLLPKFNFLDYDQNQHEVINQFRLFEFILNKLGDSHNLTIPSRSKFYFAKGYNEATVKYPSSLVINISGRAGSFKYLNDSLIFSLLHLLKGDYQSIALVAMPNDKERVEAILAQVNNCKINVISDESIFEVAKQISFYQDYIGCDGGLMHVAASLGMRVIAIFHNQKVNCWHPWTTNYSCIQAKSKNIYDVSPLEIVGALKKH